MKNKFFAGAVMAAGIAVMANGAVTPTQSHMASVTCFNLAKANASVNKIDNKVVEYTVNPGGNPEDIELEFDGVSRLYLDLSGNLVMAMKSGEFRTYNATFFQVVDGKKKLISGNFKVKGANRAAFQVGKYNTTLPLQIDAKIHANATYRG